MKLQNHFGRHTFALFSSVARDSPKIAFYEKYVGRHKFVVLSPRRLSLDTLLPGYANESRATSFHGVEVSKSNLIKQKSEIIRRTNYFFIERSLDCSAADICSTDSVVLKRSSAGEIKMQVYRTRPTFYIM